MSPFTLTATPGTDVWKKPPTIDVFNAPSNSTPTKPISSFRSARITFKGTYVQQYDQAGLLLTFRSTDPANTTPRKWLKTGVELYNGVHSLSTVACDRYADWSVTPLSAVGSVAEPVTMLIERDEGAAGISLWVYYLPPGGQEKVPLREVCWVYADEGPGEREIEVAGYVARPSESTTEGLTFEFEGFDVTWI